MFAISQALTRDIALSDPRRFLSPVVAKGVARYRNVDRMAPVNVRARESDMQKSHEDSGMQHRYMVEILWSLISYTNDATHSELHQIIRITVPEAR